MGKKEDYQQIGQAIQNTSQVMPSVLESLARGGIAQVPGTVGDVSQTARDFFPQTMQSTFGNRVAPTTEEILQAVPRINPDYQGSQSHEMVGGLVGPALGKMLKMGAEASKGLKGGLSIEDVSNVRPDIVSTRVPTAVKATENPMTSTLLSNYEAAKNEPTIFQHHTNLMSEYPHLISKSKSIEGKAEDFVNQSTNNLLWLHDQVPAETRQRSKLWYDGARNIVDRWGKEYNIPDQAASGVLAVLSPQKDWFMNVSLGNRVIDIMKNQQAFKWDKAMQKTASEIWADEKYKPMVDAIKNKRLEDITDPTEKAMWLRTFDQAHLPREHQIVSPEGDFTGVRLNKTGEPSKTGWGSLNEIAKAISIYDNPSVENVSKQLGGMHKVRNFYNNIYDPNNPLGFTTIDTHAVAANALRPFSGKSREVAHNFGSGIKGEVGPSGSSFSGLQGTYPLQYEPYQRAAKERGILPREMQSITWEAIRGLFPDTFKNATNTKIIDDIWSKVKAKKLSINDARNQILEKTGGINEPEWK
jgi:hypothetical protein